MGRPASTGPSVTNLPPLRVRVIRNGACAWPWDFVVQFATRVGDRHWVYKRGCDRFEAAAFRHLSYRQCLRHEVRAALRRDLAAKGLLDAWEQGHVNH